MNDFAKTSTPAMARRSTTFSMPRTFAPIGSTDYGYDVRRARGRRPPRGRNGFGVVAADVDVAGFGLDASYSTPTTTAWARSQCPRPATRMRRSRSWGSSSTRASGSRVRGSSAARRPLLEVASPNDITQAGPADLVVMDDFIFGETAADPAAAARTAPAARAAATAAPAPAARRAQRPQVTLRGASPGDPAAEPCSEAAFGSG